MGNCVNERIENLIKKLKEYHLDAYLVTHDINISYLTRFPASESWLLIFPSKIFYITDFRYVWEAKKGLHGIKVKQYRRSAIDVLFKLIRSQYAKRLGYDDRHISLDLYKRIKKVCPSTVQLVVKNNIVEELRAIKSREEIQKIRGCLKLQLKAYQFLKRVVKPGLTEKEIFLKLEEFVKSKKAAFSFNPIIASGPNSCFPHAKITDRKIKNNESVLIDMGIEREGYKSDLTRMFFLGKIAPLVQKVNDIVFMAQKKAIAKIRPNIKACHIDQEARNYLKKNKLAEFFGHSLGHGVGLEIHEWPRISQKSTAILKEGMIFTVEPAVYIPNKFGVRIEDMILVTKDGCEVLSN